MEENTIEHVGILGMKWGHRKNPSAVTSQRLVSRGGKTSIVSKNKHGIVVDRKVATKAQVKAFIESRKAQKVQDLIKRKEKEAKINKIAASFVAAYAIVSIAKMFAAANSANRIIQAVAWHTGRVVG